MADASPSDGVPDPDHWSRALLAGYCPACGGGPYTRVMGHLAAAHGLSSAQVRATAEWPTIEQERSGRVRENWRRLGSQERHWKSRGLRKFSTSDAGRARLSEATRARQARLPIEVKRAAAAKMNIGVAARVRRQWAAITPEERLARTAPARLAPGSATLSDVPFEARRAHGLAVFGDGRVGRAGQKVQAALRHQAADYRRLLKSLERIESIERERSLTTDERAERAGLLRQLPAFSLVDPAYGLHHDNPIRRPASG